MPQAKYLNKTITYNKNENQINMRSFNEHFEFGQGDSILRAEYGWDAYQGNTDFIFDMGESSQYNEFMLTPDRNTKELPYENSSLLHYLTLEWRKSVRVPIGQTVSLFASSRGQLYQNKLLDELFPEGRNTTVNLEPQAGLEWMGPSLPLWEAAGVAIYPFGKFLASTGQPIGTPSYFMGGRENMESPNAFSPTPTIRERGHYALGWEMLVPLDFLGNMSIKMEQKNYISPEHDSLDRRESDLLGYLQTNISEWLTLNSQLKFDQQTLKPTLADIGITVGHEKLSMTITYAVLNDQFIPCILKDFSSIEIFEMDSQKPTKQISLNFYSQLAQKWFFDGMLLKDMQTKEGSYLYGTGVHYQQNNLRIGLRVDHQFFPFMGAKPDTRFMVNFGLIR